MDALMHTAKEHTKNKIEEFPNIKDTEIVKDAIISERKEHQDS